MENIIDRYVLNKLTIREIEWYKSWFVSAGFIENGEITSKGKEWVGISTLYLWSYKELGPLHPPPLLPGMNTYEQQRREQRKEPQPHT